MKFDKKKWLEEAKEESTRFMDYPETSISKLFDEIERLEKENEALKINNSNVENKFIVMKDGDSWCFFLPDFVNLQVSEALFLDQYNADMDFIYSLLLDSKRPR